jgi:ribosomal-protein-alanine N-acetyltransferase
MLHQQGVGHVFLEVRAGNAAALALYRKSDFQETGLRRGYYADPPEDAVVMARDLSTPT